MATRKRGRHWGDSEPGQFAKWPLACGRHPNFYRLSIHAKALLFELLSQYKGRNNGDLCCAWGVVRDRGVGSRRRVQAAEKELERTGWTYRTRQGGRNMPNLYALTCFDIDECDGKLDPHVPIGKRLSYWKLGYNPALSDHEEAA